MIFEWLEDMVDEGQISEKTAEAIYSDCDFMIKNANAASLVDDAAQVAAKAEPGKLQQMFGPGTAGAAVVGALAGGLVSYLGKIIDAKKNTQQIKKNEEAIGMTFAPNTEKAKARFREMAVIAPNVASDLELSQRLMKNKVNSGFTDRDFQSLAQIQTQYNILNPAVKADAQKALQHNGLNKSAGVEDHISSHKMGEIAADCYLMTSESGIFKEAAGMFPNKGDFLKYVGALTFATSVPALLSAASGAVKHMHGKKMQAKMEEDLKDSFSEAYKRSKDTDPMKMHGKAESEKAFKTLTHFAPNVAVDPEATRGYLNRVLEMDRGLMSSDLKDLTQIESNIRNATGPSDFATGFGAASKALGVAPIAQEAVKQTMKDIQTGA